MPSTHEKCCKTQPDRNEIIISSLAIVAASISSEILLQNLGYDHFIGYKKDTISIFSVKRLQFPVTGTFHKLKILLRYC